MMLPLWFSTLAFLPPVHADITLPAIIFDHMDLKKSDQVPVLGK